MTSGPSDSSRTSLLPQLRQVEFVVIIVWHLRRRSSAGGLGWLGTGGGVGPAISLVVGVISARRRDDHAAQRAQHFTNGDRDQADLQADLGVAVCLDREADPAPAAVSL